MCITCEGECALSSLPVRHTLSINEDVQYFIQFNIQINNYIYIELNIKLRFMQS